MAEPPQPPIVQGKKRTLEFVRKLAVEARQDLHKEMQGYWIGTMPIAMFLTKYLLDDIDEKVLPVQMPQIDFSPVLEAKKEVEMYEPLVRCFLQAGLPDNTEMIISANKSSDTSPLRPDIGMIILLEGLISRHLGVDPQQIVVESFNFTTTDLVIEVKFSEKEDPFLDEPKETPCETRDGLDVRGQLAMYHEAQSTQQPRIHIFQVLICGSKVRFIRWDRSSAVVSDAIDYVENPDVLVLFLLAYANMTRCQRGWDPTVQPATDTAKDTFRTAVQEFEDANRRSELGSLPAAVMAMDDSYPVYTLRIDDDDDPSKSRECTVGCPFYLELSAIGRGTRGYLAYDHKDGKLRFLKDVWAVKDTNYLDEKKAYEALRKHNVPSLPDVICGGKVLTDGVTVQVTQNQELATAPELWRHPCRSDIRTYEHFRLLLEPLRPLTCLKNSRQIVIVCRDVAEALLQAHGKAGILHGDISYANIMCVLTDSGVQGRLADWDHCKLINGEKGKGLPFYSTTFQFMSISLLDRPHKVYDKADELEALFWVLAYVGLHHVEHTDSTFLIGMNPFDDSRETIESGVIKQGGNHVKENVLQTGRLLNFPFLCEPFRKLFAELSGCFQTYHAARRMKGCPNIDGHYGETYEKFRALVTDPAWVVKKLNEALAEDGWLPDDLCSTSQYVPLDAKSERQVLTALSAGMYDASHLSLPTMEQDQSTDPVPPPADSVLVRFGITAAQPRAKPDTRRQSKSIVTGVSRLTKLALTRLRVNERSDLAGKKRAIEDLDLDIPQNDSTNEESPAVQKKRKLAIVDKDADKRALSWLPRVRRDNRK